MENDIPQETQEGEEITPETPSEETPKTEDDLAS